MGKARLEGHPFDSKSLNDTNVKRNPTAGGPFTKKGDVARRGKGKECG